MNFKTYLLGLLLYASASLAQESLVNFGRFHSLQVYLPKGEPDRGNQASGSAAFTVHSVCRNAIRSIFSSTLRPMLKRWS